MNRLRALLLACAAPVVAAPLLASPGRAGEQLTPLAEHVVRTGLRTLHGLPLKRVIVDPEGWRRVTEGLEGAPRMPDFAQRQVVLVVTDSSRGAESRIERLERGPGEALTVILTRRQPELGEGEGEGEGELTCFFLEVPPFAGGVRLLHRSLLGEGQGFVERPARPEAADRDPARLPELGPDLRLGWELARGVELEPGEVVVLRRESWFPRTDLPARLETTPFPAASGAALGLRYPRIRDGVRHVLAAHSDRLRSQNAVVLTELPAPGPDGSPPPLRHRFRLEPVGR